MFIFLYIYNIIIIIRIEWKHNRQRQRLRRCVQSALASPSILFDERKEQKSEEATNGQITMLRITHRDDDEVNEGRSCEQQQPLV